jgi:hypothetical protein
LSGEIRQGERTNFGMHPASETGVGGKRTQFTRSE